MVNRNHGERKRILSIVGSPKLHSYCSLFAVPISMLHHYRLKRRFPKRKCQDLVPDRSRSNTKSGYKVILTSIDRIGESLALLCHHPNRRILQNLDPYPLADQLYYRLCSTFSPDRVYDWYPAGYNAEEDSDPYMFRAVSL